MLHRPVVIICALGLLATAGCQSLAVHERLDESSGATLVTESIPRVFARSQPQYSRSARDYLYLGPVEVNRQGNRVYGLWVGLATTIDPQYAAPRDFAAAELYMELRGELMALPLRRWSEWSAGAGDFPIYETPLKLEQEMVAVVTLDQLVMLAAADFTDVYLIVPGGRSQRYGLWNRDSADWSAFLGRVRGVEVRPDTAARAGPQR